MPTYKCNLKPVFFEGKINFQKSTHVKKKKPNIDNNEDNDHDISKCLQSHIFNIYRKTRFPEKKTFLKLIN